VDTASSQPGEVALAVAPAHLAEGSIAGIAPELAHSLWVAAEGESVDLTREELARALGAIGAKLNFGLPQGAHADAAMRAGFYRSLRLPELALAQACALGRERAWRRFLELYRSGLTQAAIAIAGSATAGHDLADALYSELYGLTERDGVRRSPLASYAGRGSLPGWLRTTLAQRHVDRHRKTHRETPLDMLDAPAAAVEEANPHLERLGPALARTLGALGAEERFVLSAYFLDQRTLAEIARVLKVHEATISRRVKRLTSDLRLRLLRNLEAGGLSRRAAEEALGSDPRDVEINLRTLLQSSQDQPFQKRQGERAR
jgi:RNA polymerase sigma-70 factor (ECF subfamily)